ncbi:AAA family ATPase [Fictibacillus phosphorivorans]|uniref:AAA family ATPase n=1 Tax=Fictibacillus phosphorivorans TaxID=1221500 RepID=UPI001293F63A|nr:SMC family ATPase [Fictibacillus phosphorivorans]MQR96820.1 SMC family ATPase [Fictibacillus phosphorivorans]
MRPIALTVSGLQSFREAQSVPFHELCSGGVFGIFGPTGSGKSTILDAVTLALYGKVERAAGGTHGIMNQAEDKLSVSFTFQIGEGAQQKEYSVERIFKRSGEHSIRTSTCRLIEVVDSESIVHADKERDVTRLVQELIGLTIDDFTRAVVLPQGKFAEFLSLKGADRRQMLQRLFQLEKYGDQLNQKLKKRSDEQKNRLNEITAEQTGLGEASLETLEQASVHLKENEKKLELLSKQYKEEEENLKILEVFWDAQVQNEKLIEERKELQKQETFMERLQGDLRKAIFADKIYPYANEWKQSVTEEKKIREEQERLKKQTVQLKTILDELEEKYEIAKKAINQEEPVLIEKRSGLKEAVLWEKDLDKKNQILQTETQKHKQLITSYEECEKAEFEAAQILKRGKDKQSALKKELSQIEITQKDRNLFQKAILLNQRLEDVQKEEKEIQKEISKSETELNSEEILRKQISSRVADTFDAGKKLQHHMQQKYEEVSEALRSNEKISKALLDKRIEWKNEQEKIRINQLAAQLSAELKENEPCSVCGSTTHPSPNTTHVTVEHESGRIQELEEDHERLKEHYHVLKHLSEGLEKDSQTLWEKLNLAEAEIAASDQSTITVEKETISSFSLDQLNNHITRVKGIQQDKLLIEEQMRKLLSKLEEDQKQFERISISVENKEETTNRLKQQLGLITKKMDQIHLEWKQGKIPFSQEDISEKLELFQQKESRQAEIVKSLTIAEEFLETQTKKMDSAKEQKSDLKMKISVSSNQLEMLQKEIQNVKEKLYDRVGDEKVQRVLEEVQDKLQKMKTAFVRSEREYEDAKKQYVESDKVYHAAVQRMNDVEARLEKAKQEWNKRLSQSDFQSYEDFESCLKDENVQLEWEKQLVDYHDRCKSNAMALEAIKEKLPQEILSDQHVESAKNQLRSLKQDMNHMHEAVGEARQRYMMIEKNHTRYNELEKERNKVSNVLEKLGKLQAVFRGNAFVEFMAEEQLHLVTRDASGRLAKLTRGRYAIEVDSAGGFVIRDDANGGIKRPVTSLSGGETFLTSLALALSLSAQIQLRGKFPLQFFFLDEGFGTLDQELLDTVVTALEKVRMENFSIGVISHVPELKARLTKRLIVEPAEHSGRGTRVRLDQL